MTSLENGKLRLEIASDGKWIRLTDHTRNCTWECRNEEGATVQAGADAIEIRYAKPGAILNYRWSMEDDHVVCALNVVGEISRVPLIGRFLPVGSKAEVLVPQYQGVLIRGGKPHGVPKAGLAVTLIFP